MQRQDSGLAPLVCEQWLDTVILYREFGPSEFSPRAVMLEASDYRRIVISKFLVLLERLQREDAKEPQDLDLADLLWDKSLH